MTDFTSPYEYVVAQRKEGKWIVRRVAFVALYVLYILGLLLVVVAVPVGALMAPLLCFIPVTTWMLIFFTWRYVNVEYEYTIVSGRLTFCKIYGHRTRREMLQLMLRDCHLIAPAGVREYDEKLELYAPERTFSALSSADTPDRYFATFENADGERCVFFFEATERTLKYCRLYNQAATVITKVRY